MPRRRRRKPGPKPRAQRDKRGKLSANASTRRDAEGLTAPQRLFAVEYLRDQNGTLAAIRAGYSEKGAAVTGSQLLRRPKVRALIERGLVEARERARMSVDEFHARVTARARASVGQVMAWDAEGRASLRASADLTDLELYGVRHVRMHQEQYDKDGNLLRGAGIKEIEMADPLPALEIVGKLIGEIAPAAGLSVRAPGGVGVTVDGDGEVTLYLPDNGRVPGARALPPPPVSGENGKEPTHE